MNKLIDIVKNPSGFDSLSNYAGELPAESLFVVMTRTRDSEILTESNWIKALEMLGGESEGSVEIVRFGHWACGWWEALCVVQGTESFDIGENIEFKIDQYPILDEDHFSEMESEEADRVWSQCYDKKERLSFVREHRHEFNFYDIAEMLEVIKHGKYYRGYACSLLY